MKTLFFTLVVLISSFSISTASSYKKDHGADYNIEKLTKASYKISYLSSKEEVLVEVKNFEGAMCYFIHFNQVEVMYRNDKRGFGLRMMPKQFRTFPKESRNYQEGVFHEQAVLTKFPQGRKQCLNLIASFFPDVASK